MRAVRTLTVVSQTAGGSFEYAGEVRARTESQLGFRVSGKILLDLQYSEGTSFAAKEEATRCVEARVMKLDGVDHVTTWVGSGAERFLLTLDQVFPQTNVSYGVVRPKHPAGRERIRQPLPELMAAEFPEVRARAKLLPNGPPGAYPVQFRVVGLGPAKVRADADDVKAIMRTNPNLRGINDNWNESVKLLAWR